jgi:hypothetical protein
LACTPLFFLPLQAVESLPPGSNIIQAAGQIFTPYPQTYQECPDLPSPFISGDGEEFIICLTGSDEFTIMPVTVENGEPFDYVGGNFRNKGRQLEVDSDDFPTLAETGLHSESELAGTVSITGLPVSEITRIGRPGNLSWYGFMGEDEDIISVIKKDNRIVSALGLTHPQLSRPLFHVFNLILARTVVPERIYPENRILYNHKWVSVKFQGGKGWQESIFKDDILGYWQIDIRRDLTPEEDQFFEEHYGELNEDEKSALKERLSHIQTGEMVAFLINRYGFYEGATPYRADPLAIAFIFGLKNLEELCNACLLSTIPSQTGYSY